MRRFGGDHLGMSSVALDPTGWPGTLPPVTLLDGADVSDTDVDSLCALYEANRWTYAFAGSPVPTRAVRATIEYGWDGEAPHVYVVRAGDDAGPGADAQTIVAVLEIWYSTHDNLNNVYLDVVVHPDWRRRGIGSALVELAEAWGRANARLTVMTGTREGSVADEEFAERRGYVRALREVMRRQVLADVDRDLVSDELAQARLAAADYEVLRLFGRIPEEMLDGIAEVDNAINDAPRDDLAWEDEINTGERLRAIDAGHERRGLRVYKLVARRRRDGVLAGQTTVGVHPEHPGYGHQHLTVVARDHRGHRLGMLLKAEMLTWLAEAEPQLESIDTDNAGSNDHMISINEKLGYRVTGAVWERQKRLDD